MDSMWLFWINGIARNVTTDSYKRINQIQMTIGLKTFALLGSKNYSIYNTKKEMSRFTRWRSRQIAKQFLDSFQPLGTVVDWSDEARKTGVAEFQKMQIMIAPKVSERIIHTALGGLVKPKNNK